MTPTQFKAQCIENLRTFYPPRTAATAVYEAKCIVAADYIERLQLRQQFDAQDFHIMLWLAFPHDSAFIRHMPMREQLQ